MLASEGSDIELEIIDLLRKNVRETIGDVAFGDAWKIERLSPTQLLIKPGEAWKDGLPVIMRGGKDQLVSGAVLDTGILPLGVTVTDDASGEGKVLTFGTISTPNNGDVTPTLNYRVVIEVSEQSVTDVQDPFLRNANLTESTAQKVRLVYKINIVPESAQHLSPQPYTDENNNPPNLQNKVIVTPSIGSGDVVSITTLSGAEVLDGRNLDVIINNPDTLLPVGLNAQQPFSNGTLIDSVGNSFHINQIFNDTVSGRIVLRIDKEFEQLDPEIIVGIPYTVKKGPIYNTNDDGNFIGKLYMPLSTVNFNESGGVEHKSSIVDLLTRVQKVEDFQVEIADKFDLRIAGGGDVNWQLTNNKLTWTSNFSIINPSGPEQTIQAGNSKLLEGGSLVYELNYAGGIISRGNTAINITTGGTTITVDPITFADLRVGNVVEDFNGNLTFIVGVLPSTNQIVVDSALIVGAGNIYLDSFATALAPRSLKDFVLAVRKNGKAYISALELEDGETSQIGDGISTQLLTFIGATGETDDSPNYSSNFYVTDGQSLVTSIGVLDTALDTIQSSLDSISWKDPVATEASLPVAGNSDGDVRLVLDTKIVYAWDNTLVEWLPISGTGGGFKTTFYDPIATTLPTGSTATFDGVAISNGNTVLFSNLTTNNNRVYEVSGVGSSMVWDEVRAFNGQLNPEAGDTVRFKDGEAFAEQLAVFDGTQFKINDVVRFFDGTTANFWEQSSIKTTLLNDNQAFGSTQTQSEDWSSHTLPGDFFGSTTKWIPELGQFISINSGANSNSLSAISTDGKTWTGFGTSIDDYFGLAYSPALTRLVTMRSNQFAGPVAAYSDDGGQTWTDSVGGSPISGNPVVEYSAVAWSPTLNLFAAVARAGTTNGPRIITSPNANSGTWTARTEPSSGQWFDVIWAGGTINRFIAVGKQSTLGAMSSVDGVNWGGHLVEDRFWRSIAYSPTLGLLVAVTEDRVMTSTNGTSWSFTTPPTGFWNSVTWSESRGVFYAVSREITSKVMTSPDGINWTLDSNFITFNNAESIAASEDNSNVVVTGQFSNVRVFETTVINNFVADPIFTVSSSGSENMIIDYSLTRNTTKRTGSLYLTSDGTEVKLSDISAYIGDAGVQFESLIDSGNIILSYSSTNTGEQPNLKYTVKRWSDGPGGPTGIPNYTSSASSSSVLAAGSPGQIQYHGSGGTLAAENRFVWDSSLGALNLNGLKLKVLQPSITLSDNKATPQVLFSYPISTNNFTVIEYSIVRNSNYRVGRLLVASSGSAVELSDDFTEVGTAGTTFSSTIVGTDVVISYQTTNTGFSGTFKHSRRQWQ